MTDEARRNGAKGGKARAANLSKSERSEIAKQAADARWGADLQQAVCGSPDRPLRIGNAELQAYVLEDGTRVLTQAELLVALGRHRKANVRNVQGEEQTPPVLQGRRLKPFISNELLEKSRPIAFRTPQGVRASGYRAEILPEICEVYLRAREKNALLDQQQHIAAQAEILVRGLAHVGIIALVDEATGYQEVRAQDALTRILEAFIAKELQAWVRTFPADFYEGLFRLRGLDYPNATVQRPRYFGHLTNDIVYRRLAPGVLEELKRVTPKSESGNRKHKFFQKLTTNIGYPKLREHLGAVVAIMKLSTGWEDFMMKLDRWYPRYGESLALPLEYGPDDGRGL